MSEPIAASVIQDKAFMHLGLGAASSFDDDAQETQTAKANYPLALKWALEQYDWDFASAQVELPEVDLTVTGAPYRDPERPYLYTRPSDFVALREVLPRGASFRLDADGIRSDQPGPLTIRYTRLIENETLISATCQEVIALQLAWTMAGRHGQDEEAKARLRSEADKQVAAARGLGAPKASAERYDEGDPLPSWSAEALR